MRNSVIMGCLLSAVLLDTGCGGPTIDASSEESFKSSSDEMMKSMDQAKKEKLEESIGTLMMSKVLFAGGDEATMKKNMKETFDGKNADEIIAAAEVAKTQTNAELKKMMEEK